MSAMAMEALRRIREAGENFSEWAIWAQKTAAWGMQTGYCPEQPKDAPAAQPVQQPAAVVGQDTPELRYILKSYFGYEVREGDSAYAHLVSYLNKRITPVPAASGQAITCQIYGHVVGHCGECNVGDEAAADAADTNKVLADNYIKQTCGTAAGVQGDDERKPVQAYLVHDLSRRLQAHGWRYGGPGNVFDDLTECLKKSDFLQHEHPKLNVPIDPECSAKLGDLGDDRGQGLDGYWKWGFRAGWKYGQEAATVQPDSGRDAALRVLEGYADNYDMMARIGKTGDVDCKSVAYDIRRNMVDGVRAALAAHPAQPSDAALWVANAEGYMTGLRVGLLEGASILREVYINHVFHTGAQGFDSRCKEAEQVLIAKADAAHPANGAQAGDDLIKAVQEIPAVTYVGIHKVVKVADVINAILAAAKKGT